jgi:hypothetical protein
MTAVIVLALTLVFLVLAVRNGVDSRPLDPRDTRRTSI